MIISNITPPQVWSASARSLTDIGSGALAPASTPNTTLAGAASVSFRSSAGIVGNLTVVVSTGAGSTSGIAITEFDGTTNIAILTTAAAPGSSNGFHSITTSSVGPAIINNDATHAGSYMVSQFLWTI